jgi:hypothetical protein
MGKENFVDFNEDFYYGIPDNTSSAYPYFSHKIELQNIFVAHKLKHNFQTHVFTNEIKELFSEFSSQNSGLLIKKLLKNLGHYFVYV